MLKKGLATKLIIYISFSCFLIFIAVFGYNYLISRKILIKNIHDQTIILAEETVSKIDNVLLLIEQVPQDIAIIMEILPYDKKAILAFLDKFVAKNDGIYGSTIAFEPYSFDRKQKYFSPYVYKKDGKTALTYLGSSSYDYFNWDWYSIPKKLNKPIWTEPYYDEGGGNTVMSTYSVPFYETKNNNKQLLGIITADICLEWLKDYVSTIQVGGSGYAFLISNKGVFITHPDKSLVMNSSVFSVAKELGSDSLKEIGQKMVQGQKGIVFLNDFYTKKDSWLVYAPIDSSDWSLGIIIPKAEVLADVNSLSKIVVLLGLIGLFFLSIIIFYISRKITKPLFLLAKAAELIGQGDFDVKVPIIKTGDEVAKLSKSFSIMTKSLKKHIKDLTAATAAKEKIESEIKIAKDIQMSLLNHVFPPFPDRKEIDINAFIKAAKEVGGDLYDFFFIDEKHLCFVIADVSGKGVPAALFMAIVSTLVKIGAENSKSPGVIVKQLNNTLCKNNDACMFATMFLGILDVKTGEIKFVNAGHNPPVIMSGKEAVYLKSEKNIATAVIDDFDFKEESLVLSPGDGIFLYTDGVTEANNKKDVLFSDMRLLKLANKYKELNTQGFIKKIDSEINDFAGTAPQADDITMLYIGYKFK